MTMINENGKILDEKATLFAVKEQLTFLAKHIWMMQDQEEAMVHEHSDLMDFLPYTKSIIAVHTNASYDSASRVISAMQKQEQEIAYQKQKQAKQMERMQILLYAIAALPPKEERCITLKYVKHASYEHIASALDVSVSSVGRLLQSGCFHLAQLLHLERYRDIG